MIKLSTVYVEGVIKFGYHEALKTSITQPVNCMAQGDPSKKLGTTMAGRR